MSILTQKLCKSFGKPPNPVLKDINLEIKEGEFAAIVGRSGSGKSTLLYVLSTLDTLTSGSLKIDGQNVEEMSLEEVHRFRNVKLGFVFQFHYLLPECSALENILMPAMKAGTEVKLKKHALNLLEEFGMSAKADRLPGQLSGGEQQRVAIARALVMSPKYIFADEPTGNLDSINGTAVIKLFEKINKELGTTIVFVTHDLEFASMAKRTIRLVDGQIVSQ
jgi:putative ABC transport system ATP-binding protein/lipoprotein-releasing system ATP-binding protein